VLRQISVPAQSASEVQQKKLSPAPATSFGAVLNAGRRSSLAPYS
jgi:hypothetical protein